MDAGTTGINLVDVANIVLPLLLTATGLYLAYSVNRQVKLRVSERRLTAYAELWSTMLAASPSRIDQVAGFDLPLTEQERTRLYAEFTQWYYANGNGMVLGNETRRIYLIAKTNLVCDVEHFCPESVRCKLCAMPPDERNRERGRLSIRQLSLLRTRMKADLEVFGQLYAGKLGDSERDFLVACGEDPQVRPWSG